MQNTKLKVIASLVLAFIGLLIILQLEGVFKKPTLVTVYGEGTVKIVPTTVKFTIGLSNQADTAIKALDDNKRLAKQIIAILKSSGVENDDIVVSYARVLSPGITLGQTNYRAVNSINVTLKDLPKFDSLVVNLYRSGATSISDILFTTPSSGEIEKQAVKKAIKRAEIRAKEIARVAGKRVTRMVSLNTTEIGEAGALNGAPSRAAHNGSLITSPSQIEIRRGASIVFELR